MSSLLHATRRAMARRAALFMRRDWTMTIRPEIEVFEAVRLQIPEEKGAESRPCVAMVTAVSQRPPLPVSPCADAWLPNATAYR